MPTVVFARVVVSLFIVLLVPSAVSSQVEGMSASELFSKILRENVYEVTFDGNVASGPGIEWLVAEGAAAQYFLIGERHGLAEIPRISSSIYRGLAKVGYDHAALEFGPYAGQAVEAALAEGSLAELERYLTDPVSFGSVAFLDWVEEAEMVADIYTHSSARKGVLWGLDQEFLGSFGVHLAYLAEHAETEEQRQAVDAMQTRTQEVEHFFLRLSPDELSEFASRFTNHSSVELKRRLADLQFSHNLYGPWARPKRGPSRAVSNVEREELMKRNFLQFVRATRESTGKDPKVFFKFGGFHAAPSIDSQFGRITLGTFVEEFAKVESGSAFNLFMECYSGQRKGSGQDGNVDPSEAFECASGLGQIDPAGDWSEGRHPFSDYLDEADEVLLVDLRPFRDRLDEFPFLSRDVQDVFAGFDAYLAIPNSTESIEYEMTSR